MVAGAVYVTNLLPRRGMKVLMMSMVTLKVMLFLSFVMFQHYQDGIVEKLFDAGDGDCNES